MIVGLNPVSGSSYLGYSYYLENGNPKILDQLYQNFNTTKSFKQYGLFLQIILTLFFAFMGFVSFSLVAILIPFSLILGKILSLNAIGNDGLAALQIAGIIIAYMISRRE